MKIVYKTDFKLNILMAVRKTSFELLTLLWDDEQSCPLLSLAGFVMIFQVALHLLLGCWVCFVIQWLGYLLWIPWKWLKYAVCNNILRNKFKMWPIFPTKTKITISTHENVLVVVPFEPNIENVQKLYFGNILAWFLADRHEKFMQNSLHSFFSSSIFTVMLVMRRLRHLTILPFMAYWPIHLSLTWPFSEWRPRLQQLLWQWRQRWWWQSLRHSIYFPLVHFGLKKKVSLISCKCWRIKFKRFSFVPLSKSCQCPIHANTYWNIHSYLLVCLYMVFLGRMNEWNEWQSRPQKKERIRKLNAVRRP